MSARVLVAAALAACLGPPAGAAPAPAAVPPGLLAFIRAVEAPRGYDDYERRIRIPPPRPLTELTIGEVLEWQGRVRRSGAVSTAAGGYQVIRGTLAGLVERHGLDRGARFDAAMQDRLARLLIAECGSPGPASEHPRFGNCLAGIWAGLPLTEGRNRGRSAYRGIAGNRALATPEQVLAALAGEAVRLPAPARPAAAPVPDERVLAFGAVRLRRHREIAAAMDGASAAGDGALTPSARIWSFDPYAVR